jgi:hypothetical protein
MRFSRSVLRTEDGKISTAGLLCVVARHERYGFPGELYMLRTIITSISKMIESIIVGQINII